MQAACGRGYHFTGTKEAYTGRPPGSPKGTGHQENEVDQEIIEDVLEVDVTWGPRSVGRRPTGVNRTEPKLKSGTTVQKYAGTFTHTIASVLVRPRLAMVPEPPCKKKETSSTSNYVVGSTRASCPTVPQDPP